MDPFNDGLVVESSRADDQDLGHYLYSVVVVVVDKVTTVDCSCPERCCGVKRGIDGTICSCQSVDSMLAERLIDAETEFVNSMVRARSAVL